MAISLFLGKYTIVEVGSSDIAAFGQDHPWVLTSRNSRHHWDLLWTIVRYLWNFLIVAVVLIVLAILGGKLLVFRRRQSLLVRG